MIKEVSAISSVPAAVGKVIKKSSVQTSSVAKNVDDIVRDKLSYVRHAENTDIVDPFTKEHFDYLRYLGVRD